jgi:hypothetical protein
MQFRSREQQMANTIDELYISCSKRLPPHLSYPRSMSCTTQIWSCLPQSENPNSNMHHHFFPLSRIVAYESVSIVKTNQRSISKEDIYTTHFCWFNIVGKSCYKCQRFERFHVITQGFTSPIFHSEMGWKLMSTALICHLANKIRLEPESRTTMIVFIIQRLYNVDMPFG